MFRFLRISSRYPPSFPNHPSFPPRCGNLRATMSLEINLKQQVDCQQVVGIAKQACEAILSVYNSEVRWISAFYQSLD